MAVFSAISAAAAWVASYVFTAAAGAGMAFGTALAIGKAAGYLATAAIYATIARKLTPKVNVPRSEVKAVMQQTDMARRVHVGRNLSGGLRVLFEVKDGTLYQLIVFNHGAIHEFRALWVDGVRFGIAGRLNFHGTFNGIDGAYSHWTINSGPMTDRVSVAIHRGEARGGGDPQLQAAFPYWTESYRLYGQASYLMKSIAPRAEDFSSVYPKGSQALYQVEFDGIAVYDPRSGGWGYSDNAALVILRYLTHPDGFRLSFDDINLDSVRAMANYADAQIRQWGGGYEKRLALWGYWTLDEDPAQVLERMRISSGIHVYEDASGKMAMLGGGFGTPACTITTRDIQSIETGSSVSEREGFNVLRVQFMSAAQNFEMTEVEPWRDETRLAQEGEIVEEFIADMCPNQAQARFLARHAMADRNRAKHVIVTNAVGLKARYPRAYGQRHTINLDYRPNDGSGRVLSGEFEVLDHDFDPVMQTCQITLGAINRALDVWEPAYEGWQPAPLPAEVFTSPPPPISASVVQVFSETAWGQGQVTLKVSALPVAGREDLRLEAIYTYFEDAGRYPPLASDLVGAGAIPSGWNRMQNTSDTTAITPVLQDGVRYAVRVRWRGSFSGHDNWEYLEPITALTWGLAPNAPKELIASPGVGYVHLSWRNPVGNFVVLRVYRGEEATLAAAELVAVTGGVDGQISEVQDPDVETGNTYFYWVRAVNGSGLEGPAVGPVEITL